MSATFGLEQNAEAATETYGVQRWEQGAEGANIRRQKKYGESENIVSNDKFCATRSTHGANVGENVGDKVLKERPYGRRSVARVRISSPTISSAQPEALTGTTKAIWTATV